MAAGAQIQLVNLGTQDEVLTGQPEISFFVSAYVQYVNFAMDTMEQSFTGTADFGRKFQCEFQSAGDLVMDCFLEMTLPSLTVRQSTPFSMTAGNAATFVQGSSERVQWVDNLANTIVKEAEIMVGSVPIDKHVSEWFTIWNELTLPEEKRAGYNDLIGQENVHLVPSIGAYQDDVTPDPYSNVPGTVVSVGDEDLPFVSQVSRFATVHTAKSYGLQTPKISHPSQKIRFIPRFWFMENPGFALPLIALQYHKVYAKFELRPFRECYVLSANDTHQSGLSLATGQSTSLVDAKFWVNYVQMEAKERRIIAKKSHEYLITQTQHTGEEAVSSQTHRARLQFNHPCSAIYWVVREDEASAANQWNNFNTYKNSYLQDTAGPPHVDTLYGSKTFIGGRNPFQNVLLQIHSPDRFARQDGDYFTRYQPYRYHSRVPKSNGIAMYSFCLNAESTQPCGSANMSRLSDPTLIVNFTQISAANTGKFFSFARNTNLFRIAGGMGGLAFA